MMNLKRNVLGMVVGGIALIGVASPSVLAQDAGKPGKAPAASQPDKKEHKAPQGEAKGQAGAKVGEQAPAFELKDTDGKTVKLEDYKGKIVVIDWFNPDCPVCAGHYKANTVQNLVTKFKDKSVVFLAINSGGAGMQGAGVERNAEAKKTWNVAFPILLDESGKVGKLYGAKTTPHCYVVDAKGTLVYAGAIDDGAENYGGKIGKVNYVEKAVEQTLKGETVTTSTTKPYGCSVKYSKGA
jgi:peroxiredoxin